ncbi:MAG TPA: hypothetical protein VKT33_01960 [Candidatus Angelobacter sp.]|nr:hypothetical protein [Candidatus Angelobacter sp.]
MKVLKTFCVTVLASGLMLAQTTTTPSSGSDSSNIANELKQLQESMAAQQKAIAEQQKKIAEQQAEIEKLKHQQSGQEQTVSKSGDSQAARVVNASLNTVSPVTVAAKPPQDTQPKESPLSFKIGGADFTPGGFMDFTTIFRSTNTGAPGGTNFFSIPFSNSVSGHLSETRLTAANSRLSIKAHDQFGKNDVTGYAEMDFLGNDGANVEVSTNSHTFRQRLYFVDVKRDKFEFLAGQAWSWLTPNRVGVSPYPSDIFYSQNIDFNYQVGLTWTRAPQIRFIYHPSEHWAMGVALENPEQFGGQGEITFPAFFNAQLSNGTTPQIDQANSSATPNLHPDIIPKVTYDTDFSGKHFHAEVAGLLSGFKTTNLVGPSFVTHTKEGAGVSAAINYEVVRNVHIVANGFYSDGGARYLFGSGPDVVALPTLVPGAVACVPASGAGCDIRLSPVHAGSSIVGFEAQVTPKTLIYGYYGGEYFQRNFAADITNATPGKFVGFGGPNSSNNNNRAIQEPTLGWTQTFWKHPQYGALQLMTQASYLTRSPWFVAAGAPKNAHLFLGMVNIRYVLP